MSAVPFHYIDLRAFCYSTEDEKRVAQALHTFLPEDTELDRAENEGFHGDRIVVFSARLENADYIRHVLRRLAELEDFDQLLTELNDRIDEDCSFFVHLDKQAAFADQVELGQGIALRGKVKAYPAKKETAVENAREALQEL